MTDLDIRNLTVEYSSAGYKVRPIEGLDLQASSGELVLLLGPSGCGKTTLLSCLAGILTPTSGEILVGGRRVDRLTGVELTDYRRETVGIVFQAFNLIPSLTALENVEVPLRSVKSTRKTARERARELVDKVGLADRSHHRPGDLSGGQQQRVAIARALAHDPPLLLADEPTAHLDYVQVESILRLIRELASPGRLVVVATHDDRMTPLADRVVEMAPRFTAAAGDPQTFHFEAGETVFLQGERGELIFVIEEGEVEIERERSDGTVEVVAVVPTGDYFGELGPLLGFPRAATARARSAVRATGYPVKEFRRLLGDDPRLAGLLGASAKASAARPKPARPRARATRSRKKS